MQEQKPHKSCEVFSVKIVSCNIIVTGRSVSIVQPVTQLLMYITDEV